MKRNLVLSAIVWVISLAVVYWLVGGSVWLSLILASAIANTIYLSAQVRENRLLFDMADAEVVRVSALASRLEEEIAELKVAMDHQQLRDATDAP